MYCEECGRWIDAHEVEARDNGQCNNQEACATRKANPNFPGYYSDGIVVRSA